eukprot:7366565-Prymnesium_polylepis.1
MVNVRTTASIVKGHKTSCTGDAQQPSDSTSWLIIPFEDRKSIVRNLELHMPNETAVVWKEGLRELLSAFPRLASPAHWRWGLSCLAATSRRGRTGLLRPSELRSLARYANASSRINGASLTQILSSVEQNEQLELPPWLQSAESEPELLHARQMTQMLLVLCTQTPQLTALFQKYAIDGRVKGPEWLTFVHSEQLGAASNDGEAEQAHLSYDAFELDRAEQQLKNRNFHRGLSPLHFGLHILSPLNDAIVKPNEIHLPDAHHPFSHYWNACSHK